MGCMHAFKVSIAHPSRTHAHMHTVVSSHIYDFALVFTRPNNPPVRIDLTIIPKVFRNGNLATASLCRPSPATAQYIPRKGSCNTRNSRAPNLARISSDYALAHPEEKAWLDGRLGVTGPLVMSFVRGQNSTWVLGEVQSKLKIAIVHSGGGKRAMLQSIGT